nr:ribonuclease H-like domain-containing protein [Tanacetum cinerariifolium]
MIMEKKYACELLERANMVNCNPSRTPVDTDSKMGPEGVAVQDPTLYCSLAGGLRYLTFTRPDLSYAIQQICLYMHDPWEPHFAALKRILRVEAEYHGVANVVAETAWLDNLLCELHFPLSTATWFLERKKTMVPALPRIAMDLISVQASSIASESAFSTSGRVLSIRRTRLSPVSLEMCICLKDHLDAKVRKQDKCPFEIPLDFEEDVFDDEVQ